MQKDPIVILSFARTPLTNFLGLFKEISATELGSKVIQAVVERAKLEETMVDEVIMGCVLPAGLGQAPARQAALFAGLPNKVPCTTINKVCGSGMKAVIFAHDSLLVGSHHAIVAGGMENMTNAPYLLLEARQGYRLGQNRIYDHMMLDGLEDAYDKGQPMGYFAEECVKKFGFTRKQQDDFALASFERAKLATQKKWFAQEIVPVTFKTKKGEQRVDQDEHPFSVNPERIPTLAPVFVKEGTITAGNSSSIADGAAALLLMRQSEAQKQGKQGVAIIRGYSNIAKEPAEFTTAPIDATRQLLKKLNWDIKEVDLFEVNEAFAVVALAFMQELNIPHEKINVHGGACALGHPIGASGARIIVTLIAALQERNLKRGIATLCIGGGEATAIAIELIGS